MRIINWSRYRRVIENVPAEDGGGLRIFYPTFGYGVYGVGDTLDEALRCLDDSKRAYVGFINGHSDYCVP